MKKLLLPFLLVLAFCARGQRQILTESARVFVITCGPGQQELYTAFGHSAFWVYDSIRHIDVVYNYGIFDFRQPHFYLNFTRGYLYYKLGTDTFDEFAYPYEYFNRYLHAQELNLLPDQKEKLFAYLRWNAQPENVTYRYDYFYNNCATKIRDVMAEVFGKDVMFDGSYITTDYTIRDLTDLYIEKQQPWGDLGIDICLGLPMDKKASPYEYMFLPEYIEASFDHATIKHDSTTEPLVKKKIDIFTPREETPEKGLPHPLYVFIGFLSIAVLLTLWDLKRKKISNWFDVLLLTATGLLGLLLTVLWFFTDHQAAAKNFNLLWAMPFNIIAVIAMIRGSQWLEKYFLVIGIISALTLVFWKLLPQELHYALIPIVSTIAMRAFVQYYLRRRGV